jgi:hypothetical protein
LRSLMIIHSEIRPIDNVFEKADHVNLAPSEHSVQISRLTVSLKISFTFD